MNYSIKKTILLICFSIFTVSVTMAQGTVAPQVKQQQVTIVIEDAELDDYIEALNELQEVQSEMQEEMMEIITEEGLDAETFSNIQRAKAMQKQDPEVAVDFDEETIKKFNKAAEKVVELQTEANEEMQEIVQESGIELVRFQEISLSLQSDADLQRRFRDRMDMKMNDEKMD